MSIRVTLSLDFLGFHSESWWAQRKHAHGVVFQNDFYKEAAARLLCLTFTTSLFSISAPCYAWIFSVFLLNGLFCCICRYTETFIKGGKCIHFHISYFQYVNKEWFFVYKKALSKGIIYLAFYYFRILNKMSKCLLHRLNCNSLFIHNVRQISDSITVVMRDYFRKKVHVANQHSFTNYKKDRFCTR